MKRLNRFYIEITNVCNMSCSFCIGNVRPARFMSADEFKYTVKQVKPFTDYIYLHVLGEPLLHPELPLLLKIAADNSMKVNITTNGTLLTKTQSVLLNAKALRKVSISLHSMESSAGAREYLQSVAEFSKEAAQNGIICELRLWNLNAPNTDNVNIFDELCGLFSIDNNKRQDAEKLLSESDGFELSPCIFLESAKRFNWPSLKAKQDNKELFCYGLRSQAAVLCDGTVVPCCLDSKGDINLGNIFLQPLEQILESSRAKQIHNGFSQRRPVEELCRHCGYASRF